MTNFRISQNQVSRNLLQMLLENRQRVARLGDQASSGLKVVEPGDTNQAGVITQFRESVSRFDGHKNRIEQVKSTLAFQDEIMSAVGDLLIRAREIAAQNANDPVGQDVRAQGAGEVFQLRNQLVALANSQYGGAYVYGGTSDQDAPYDLTTDYVPGTGESATRYVYDNTTTEPGNGVTRSVNITDDISIETQTLGSSLFDNALYALDRLGRALAGYSTNPASGAPDGTGAAYTFPDQYQAQSTDIRSAMALIDTARSEDILPERVSIGARQKRVELAESFLEIGKSNARELLGRIQDADVAETATELTLAQSALEASLKVTTNSLRLTILDYL